MTGTNWTTYGTTGSGVGQLSNPFGITLDSAGRIYVADSTNNRIVRFDDMSGTNWTAYGTTGAGVGQFASPVSVAVDASNRIYIVDGMNDRIVRINDMTGAGWVSLGSAGSGVNQFGFTLACSFGGLTIGPDQKIYVADSGNHRIVRMDDMTGTNWTTLGSMGSGTDQFHFPDGIAVR
jgi:streptogramin lyase